MDTSSVYFGQIENGSKENRDMEISVWNFFFKSVLFYFCICIYLFFRGGRGIWTGFTSLSQWNNINIYYQFQYTPGKSTYGTFSRTSNHAAPYC